MRRPEDFFQIGGTLSEDAPSYIERPADTELLAALERHQFCLILAPRQMGKSSLMVHAISCLKKKGVTSAVVDLQLLGSEDDFERWFIDVIYQIKRTAKLKTDTGEWWIAHRDLGPTQRFIAFLEEVLLNEVGGDVVLFFDEIDSVLNLPFSDDFFTTIRSLYNSRAVNPVLNRLTVVLLGVATASSFIKDRTRTPFNIGKSISLTDFPREKTKPFQEVLGPGSEQLVDRIFYWTNGQPLMVQKLAAAAYALPPERRSPQQIDQEVVQSFLQLKIEQDTHLKFIQDYLLEASSNVRKTLGVYRDVLSGKEVESNEQSQAQDRLKLAGVVRVKEGKLALRNRIYQNIFNLQWMQEHLPANIQKWVAYGASTAFLFLLVGVTLWFFLSSGKTGDGSLGGRPLRVGIVSWPGYVGGIYANNGFKPNQDCIFYKKYGIEVEFILLEDPAQRNQAFIKGGPDGVDIVWSTVDYWANELPGLSSNGVKSRAIMQVDWSRGGDALVADQSIKSIEDLKGKKISIVKFTPSHWLLEFQLKNSSLTEAEQKQIEDNLVGKDTTLDARQAFISNQVDATVVWEPDVTLALERPGSHKLVSTATATDLIADIMVAREGFIKERPGVLRSFIQAWFDGTAEASRNRERAAQLLMENEPLYGDMNDKGKVMQSLSTVKWADLTDNTIMFGLDGRPALFDKIFNEAGKVWVERGYIKEVVPADSAKDDTFLKDIFAAATVSRSIESALPPPDAKMARAPGILTKHVNLDFASGSYGLSPKAKEVIDKEVMLLVKANGGAYIRVEGNTDDLGAARGGSQLSLRRAHAVVDYLVERYGFNRNRFITVGNVPDNARAPSTTEEGRAANRRIDIVVVPAQ